jgi:hypothetical protein
MPDAVTKLTFTPTQDPLATYPTSAVPVRSPSHTPLSLVLLGRIS